MNNCKQIITAPCLFLSHGGGPALFSKETSGMFKDMNINSKFASFYRNLSTTFERPQAIIMISAHWEETYFTVNCHQNQQHPLLYDYYGFPSEFYAPEFIYPCLSSSLLEDKVYNLIVNEFGTNEVKKSSTPRGFDHGKMLLLLLLLLLLLY